MAVLKYFDGSDWEPVVSALQGPTGPTGAASTITGPTGATGPTGSDASSGLVLINTTSFSGVTAVSFPDNTFTSTYDRYLVLWFLTTVTSGIREIGMRLRSGGSDLSSAGSYNYRTTGVNGAGSTVNTDATTTYMRMVYSETTDKTMGNIYLPRTTSEVSKKIFGDADGKDSGGNNLRVMYGANVTATTAYDSMSLINFGSTNMSGTMSAYGYAK
jgi:hypothetical protein